MALFQALRPILLPAFESPLSQVKEKLKSRGYLEGLIRRHLLDNQHRSVVLLRAEPGLAAREAEEEEAKFAEIKDSLSSDEVRRVIEDARTLQRIQASPDSPEALATIPVLKVSDLDRRNKAIPIEQMPADGLSGFYHDLFTGGITYLDVGFNLRSLPAKYLPYVPLLGRVFLEMGTDLQDFVSLSQKISRKTGGIRPEIFCSAIFGESIPAAWLFLRGKSMSAQVRELTDILAETLGAVKLNNRDRFRQIVLEEKARQERRIVPSGHQVVNQRIRAHFNQADWVRELTGGISYFLFLGKLAGEIDDNWDKVLSELEDVRRLLTNRSSMVFNLTADRKDLRSIEPHVQGFLRTLPNGRTSTEPWQQSLFPEFEGIMIPSQVNYVGKGADLYREGYELHGSSKVITGYLRASWLWEKVRVLGGAYGGFCLFDRMSGVLTYVSYRDPNLIKTIENFDGAAQFLRSADLPDDEIRKAIIGAIGDIDSYMLPDMKGYVSMLRSLTGDSDETRQRMRDEVLGTTAKDFRDFAEVLEKVNRNGIVKVLGSQTAIESALEERPMWLKTFRLL